MPVTTQRASRVVEWSERVSPPKACYRILGGQKRRVFKYSHEKTSRVHIHTVYAGAQMQICKGIRAGRGANVGQGKGRTRGAPCSFLAVKTMVPVSSPTRHSAIFVWRRWPESGRPFCSTVFELTTLTVSVWPLVPGFSWSTFTNTGFLLPAAAGPPPCCRCPPDTAAVDILPWRRRQRRWGRRKP